MQEQKSVESIVPRSVIRPISASLVGRVPPGTLRSSLLDLGRSTFAILHSIQRISALGPLLKSVFAGLVMLVSLPALAQYEWGSVDSFAVEVNAWETARPPTPPSPQLFDRELSPYGRWFWLPAVGRVWQPYSSVVGSDFVPYTSGGNWEHTSAGWTFQSNYRWGWAPFHYGRWHLASSHGWVWQPGTEWAPAWVTWRSSPGYLAWAPLPPAGVQLAFDWGAPCWSFVEQRYFGQPQQHRYVVPRSHLRGAPPVPRHGWSSIPPVRQARAMPPPPRRVQQASPPPHAWGRGPHGHNNGNGHGRR